MTTQQQNIEKLVELGFRIFPREVPYYKYPGSTQMDGKPPFSFFVGRDYVVGHYSFFQDWDEFRMAEDDIYILMLKSGLQFPELERSSEPDGVLYSVGIRGKESEPVHNALIKTQEEIQKELTSRPATQETAEQNFELISGRFSRQMGEILQPIGDIETYGQRRAKRAEDAKKALVGQMSLLIAAVREGAEVKYGTIIERIKELGLQARYNPQEAIANIVSGKYNGINPQSKT